MLARGRSNPQKVPCLALHSCLGIAFRYYALAAAAALLKYIEYIQSIMFAQKSLKISYTSIEDCCLIGECPSSGCLFVADVYSPSSDLSSWTCMDLVSVTCKSAAIKERSTSLLDTLNTCVTPGGQRTLRSCLLQPSANLGVINARLDVVEELVRNQAVLQRSHFAFTLPMFSCWMRFAA